MDNVDSNGAVDAAQEVPRVTVEQDALLNDTAVPSQPLGAPQKDTIMSEAPIDQASPVPAGSALSPAPARTGTPVQGSRAASAHPEPGVIMPAEAAVHGDPTRRYLNTNVTGVLLEGMKLLAKEQPSDPLRVLGEYLIEKSKEM